MPPPRSRNQPLDILRGVAILLVLTFHWPSLRTQFKMGWSGVDLFFVLSGFLISGLLFSEYSRFREIRAGRFLIRRAFKIYPAFYVFMIYTLVEGLATGSFVLRNMLAEVFFVQDYFTHVWLHTWSLAVEEQFYLVLPLLLLLMIKILGRSGNPFRAVPWTFVVIATGCLLFRTIRIYDGVDPGLVTCPIHARMDSLFAGVFLSYCWKFKREAFLRAAKKPIWALGVVLLLPAVFFPLGTPIMNSVGFTSVYIGYACLLVWAVPRAESRNPLARSTAWIGRYSYSIYLWHYPIVNLVLSGHQGPAAFFCYAAASIVFGAGMSWLIEIPNLKLRDRLFPVIGPAAGDYKVQAEGFAVSALQGSSV